MPLGEVPIHEESQSQEEPRVTRAEVLGVNHDRKVKILLQREVRESRHRCRSSAQVEPWFPSTASSPGARPKHPPGMRLCIGLDSQR